MPALTCHEIFGDEQGAAMVALVRDATGQPCPCEVGRDCPLAPLLDDPAAARLRAS